MIKQRLLFISMVNLELNKLTHVKVVLNTKIKRKGKWDNNVPVSSIFIPKNDIPHILNEFPKPLESDFEGDGISRTYRMTREYSINEHTDYKHTLSVNGDVLTVYDVLLPELYYTLLFIYRINLYS